MHKQLTAADRKAVEILLKEKYTFSSIANKIGVDKSTICREVNKRSIADAKQIRSFLKIIVDVLLTVSTRIKLRIVH